MRPSPAAADAHRSRPHIYVLDHEPSILDFVRELLCLEEFDGTASTCAPESFEVIDLLGPDLVVVDLAWGERAGWVMLEVLAVTTSPPASPCCSS
jgi:DNA-binding response OmpR family regulator